MLSFENANGNEETGEISLPRSLSLSRAARDTIRSLTA